MKIFLGLSCLLVAICHIDCKTFIAIGSLQTEADTLVKEIVPAIQQEAAKFAQAVVQLNNATTPLAKIEVVRSMLDIFINTYQLFGNDLHQICTYTTTIESNNQTSGEIAIPSTFMDLFLSKIYQVSLSLDNIIIDIQDLEQVITGVIQTQKQGQIVIPKRIVNVIVANINNISSLNEEITTELDSAIAIANHDLGPYITNGKPLSAKASVIIEVLRILGEYLGDVTNSISKSTHVNPSQLPVTPINHEQDVVEMPQLLQELNRAFGVFQHLYSTLGRVFSTIQQVLPIGFAFLEAI